MPMVRVCGVEVMDANGKGVWDVASICEGCYI